MNIKPDPRAQLGAHSHRRYWQYTVEPVPPPPAPRVHLDRAALLFGLPALPAALLGWLVWPAQPFVAVVLAVGVYGAGFVALTVAMFASLQEQRRERER